MRFFIVFLTIFSVTACGPDINSPASNSVGGKWQSPDSASYFFAISLDIAQTANGDISGTWTSKLKGGNLSCPAGTTCNAANTASGRNTVVGVSIEILGIGKFTGQLEGGNVLRGDIYRFDGDYKVTFTKVP